MNKTKIPWADWTWNPVSGCAPISEGCKHCYAAAISRRFHLPWGKPLFHPERMDQPGKVKKPGRVFVGSMTDLGHPGIDDWWFKSICNAMVAAPWHTYIVLTKRPGLWISWLPATCWFGVTVESQMHMERWKLLRKVTYLACPVKFVSVEPMLGPVTFTNSAFRPDWVIAGPETGPGARRCEDAWIDALAAESPCFFDKRGLRYNMRREFPKEVR